MYLSTRSRSIVLCARFAFLLVLTIGSSTAYAVDCENTDTVLKAIRCLEAKVSALQTKVDKLQGDMTSIPKSSVVPFFLTDCPSGWALYKPAQGRFIRGIDRSGKDVDPDGERAPGAVQKDQFAEHAHALPGVVYDAGGGPNASWVAAAKNLGYGHINTPPTATAGKGNETRPVNVALLYCIKQ